MDERTTQNSDGDDERVRKYLIEHLVHDSRYPALIDAVFEVKDGSVTLSGTVPHRVMKSSVEETAARRAGVTHVKNNLTVALIAAWHDLSFGPNQPSQG